MTLKEFITKVEPHNYSNSAPPFGKVDRHLWESKQLYSVIDCLHDNCTVLDFGCGGNGTLQHTLFSHYPNATYYGLDTDFVSVDNKGFLENKNKSKSNVYFKSSEELDEVLPKVDCMVMGSVFTHLSISKMEEILNKTLPHYDRGFQLGFTAFMSNYFSFVTPNVYGPETYGYTILDFKWFKDYCLKNGLTIVYHPYKQNLKFKISNFNYQAFLTIKKKD
jgi:hypothetical protein